ncbi:hypothetical protein DZF91_13995 [Actinomadura logoneensis]|uniref:Rieske-like [2Fe-2S] domain-containing protein n=2 Tax=Actinomadura logoneensis TaxID=2293572 RepID=A0A372JLX5_9ACTN|nr:hypothetical protein DZF91_13995 [Actinomadura logoneensis]
MCRIDEPVPERGVAALVAGVQVAPFRTSGGGLHAVDDLDPFAGVPGER